MNKLLTILALTATTYAGKITANDEEMKTLWAAWKDNHGKSYTEDEEPTRLAIFAENFNKITAHNAAGNSTVVLGLNKFSDLTGDEFKYQYASGHLPIDSADAQPAEEEKRFLGSLPASVDWRTKGAVTAIKDQYSCGGCWAFATAAQLESLHFIKTGSLENFSMQQIIDCDKTSSGCKVGHINTAFDYTAQYGVEPLSTYPFVEKTSTCKYSSSRAVKVNKGRGTVTPHSSSALMAAVVNQPVSVVIEANQSVFQHYKSGVITSGCGSSTDHAVSVVGYTTVNGVQSFIVKNSWGTGWGQSGYFYITTNGSANSGRGVCGILTGPVYPTA